MIQRLPCMWLLSIGGALALATQGMAQEPQPSAKSPPKGLRVLFNGNSWFGFVPGGVADQVKAAGIEGHKEVRMAKPNDFSVLEAGEVDVYAHGVHWWMETPWSHGVISQFGEPRSTFHPFRFGNTPYLDKIRDRQKKTMTGPVFLQDHGNPVRFRNIWVVPADDHAFTYDAKSR